mgnify:FL=1
MKNALLFFYNIFLEEIEKINDNYYFTYQNSDFVVHKYIRNIEEVINIYNLNKEMLQNNIITYEIILTKENNVLFYEETSYYLLMKLPNIKNRIITIDDVLSFNYVSKNNYNLLDKSMWSVNWEKKIDYIEYQFSQMSKKYKNINEGINYYLGIWENAISYYNDNVILKQEVKFICHKRLEVNTDLLEFLNPLNFVIDYKERDIGDYLKSYIINEKYTYLNLKGILNKLSHDRNDVARFITRLMFPSFYFDKYEEIIINEEEDKSILYFNTKINSYEDFLRFIFNYYKNLGLPYLTWLFSNKKED